MQCVYTSWSDFISMGGFGGYVWTAYGLIFIGFAWGIIASRRQHKQFFQSVEHETKT